MPAWLGDQPSRTAKFSLGDRKEAALGTRERVCNHQVDSEVKHEHTSPSAKDTTLSRNHTSPPDWIPLQRRTDSNQRNHIRKVYEPKSASEVDMDRNAAVNTDWGRGMNTTADVKPNLL